MEMQLIYTITAAMKTFKHKNIVISQKFLLDFQICEVGQEIKILLMLEWLK